MAITLKDGTTEFEGRVLSSHFGYYRVMSDEWGTCQYATVWTPEGKIQQRALYDNTKVEVDATEAVKAEVKAYLTKLFLEMYVNREIRDFQKVGIGDEVEVVHGRTAKGLKGRVEAVIKRPYSMGYRAVLENKLCIPLDDEKVTIEKYGKSYEKYVNVAWVWARNCKKLGKARITAEVMDHFKQMAEKRAQYFLDLTNAEWHLNLV